MDGEGVGINLLAAVGEGVGARVLGAASDPVKNAQKCGVNNQNRQPARAFDLETCGLQEANFSPVRCRGCHILRDTEFDENMFARGAVGALGCCYLQH